MSIHYRKLFGGIALCSLAGCSQLAKPLIPSQSALKNQQVVIPSAIPQSEILAAIPVNSAPLNAQLALKKQHGESVTLPATQPQSQIFATTPVNSAPLNAQLTLKKQHGASVALPVTQPQSEIFATVPVNSAPLNAQITLKKQNNASVALPATLTQSEIFAKTPAHHATASTQTTALNVNQPLAFSDAVNYVLEHSDKLLAAQASWLASHLQSEALNHLNRPSISVSSTAGYYSASADISTDGLRKRIRGYGDNLSTKLAGSDSKIAHAIGKISNSHSLTNHMPSDIHASRSNHFLNANITAMMPIYTGGRIEAIQKFAHGRADVEASEFISTKEALITTLIKRYFQVQLAKRLVDVRQSALKTVKAHDHAAQRMLDVGLIAKVERLQGSTALADAKFELQKAKDNQRLAQRALYALLQSEQVALKTDIFVNHDKLAPLAEFQAKARAHYPAFAKIDAKGKQAQAMKSLSDAAWKPRVNAFGTHQIGKNSNWLLGLNAQWNIHSPRDRKKMQQASDATLTKVDAIRRQAQQDVNLLVEKNWLAVKDARNRYDSLEQKEKLGQEVFKLNKAGFREGISTVIDVSDASAKLMKTRAERAYAAYEYVIALSELLASAGDVNAFNDYLPKAIVR